jgi:predicted acyltransferase
MPDLEKRASLLEEQLDIFRGLTKTQVEVVSALTAHRLIPPKLSHSCFHGPLGE